MKRIILASGSPRRRKLLEATGIKFQVAESRLEEDFDPKLEPHKLAKKLSFEKAKSTCKRYPPAGGKNSIIIAADTLAVLNGKVFGKPIDENEAKEMLRILNGKMHYVITGFTVYDSQTGKFITKSVTSKVYFNKISEREINDYVTSKKPFDKAGGYGIQELPKNFIKKIDGDYDNVIGLPIHALLQELKKLEVF